MKEIAKKFEELKKETEDVIKSEFSKIIDENLKGIQWMQYTPGFNDGDPCEFTMTEFTYGFSTEFLEDLKQIGYSYEQELDEEDGAEVKEICYFEIYSNKIENHEFKNESLKKSMDKIATFEKEIYEIDHELREMVFKSTFGNDVRVTFDGTEFVTEAYDCGY